MSKTEIDIVDWFQPDKLDHLKAWQELCETGVWPKGFLPPGAKFPSLWEIRLEAKMARQHVKDQLRAREIAEHGADCKISIGRVHCSHGQDYVHIQLDDSNSGSLIFDGRMKLADYAKCTTGLSCVDIVGEHICSHNVGRTSEHKTIDIRFPNDGTHPSNHKKTVRDIIAGYEQDGWTGRDSDASNHHKYKSRDGDNTVYEIGFRRYV